MEKIKKVNWLSFAKLHAVMLGTFGLACGILYSFGGFIVDALVSMGVLSPMTWETPGLSYGTVLAFGALIGMPLIFAVCGFVVGLLEVPFYNLYAKRFGGIKVDFE